MLEGLKPVEPEASGFEAIIDVLELPKGVAAIGCRGRLAAEVRALLRDESLDATFQVGTTGDLALALRDDRQLVVRVVGRAAVLIRRMDGRTHWIEQGMARYPGETVADQLLVVGIALDQALRDALETWFVAGHDAAALQELDPERLESAVGLVGRDLQRARAPVVAEGEEAEGLLDLLAEVADWDDRATPDVVRRTVVPGRTTDAPRSIGPGVFEADAVSTPVDSGPPFQPFILIDPFFVRAQGPTLSPFTQDAEPVLVDPSELVDAPVTTIETPPAAAPSPVAANPIVDDPTPATEGRTRGPSTATAIDDEPTEAVEGNLEADALAPTEQPPQEREEPLRRYRDDSSHPFSIDPIDDRLVQALDVTPVEPARARWTDIPLWVGAVIAMVVIGSAFAVSWAFLLLL